MAKDLEAPKPFVPSVFSDGDKLDAGNVEEMRFGLAGSGPLAKAVLDSNVAGTLRQLTSGGAILTPVGSIVPYAGTDVSTPAGWLFCGGQAVSRTTYADLFVVVGTTYGSGDGSTTFNVPDLRGRVVAGKDNMAGSAASRLTAGGAGITGTTLGASGGTETHTLTTAQIPSHTHGLKARYNANPWNNEAGVAGTDAAGQTLNTVSTATGGGAAHPITQPTLVTNYIIKALPDTVTGYAGAVLTGAAGGMLSGTYPNPSVASISGLAAGGGLTGTYPNPTIASVGTAALPAGSVVQVQRYEWGNVTTMSGATWVNATNSSYTFTPIYSNSKLFIFADISVNSYWPGGPGAGASTRLLWRGGVITTQSSTAGHENYVQAQDNYQRAAKNAVATAGSGAGVLSLQVMAWASTPTVNINQANQWASGYTIFEVKQ